MARSNAIFGLGSRRKHVWQSKLLEEYAATIGLGEPGIDRSEWVIEFPPVFSLIDTPDESLDLIAKTVELSRNGARRIVFDQSKCKTLDMCAGALLNVVVTDATVRLKTRISGQYPADREALEIVAAVGLPRLLGLPRLKVPGFEEFRLRHGGRKRRTLAMPTLKEKVSEDLTLYLTKCYRDLGHSLPSSVGDYLGALVGEALANSEEHAEGHDWYVSGYLRKPDSRSFGDCHLTFFNFGVSLGESIQQLPKGPHRQDLEDILREHRRAGFFGVRADWTEQAFWTLQALQEGVSRKSTATSSRGVGTADMISAFQQLGGTNQPGLQSEMCLVSGEVQLLFKPQYPMGFVEMEDGTQRRVIALNAENDVFQPPATGCVRMLRHRFPGTLFSLRFFIDPDYLENIVYAEDPDVRKNH